MAASVDPYDVWLSSKLLSLNSDVDTDVFVSYISGILSEDDTTVEEKKESLESIIQEVAPGQCDIVCNELIAKWSELQAEKNEAAKGETGDIGDKLSQMMSVQTLAVAKERQLSSDEKARKSAVLAHYNQVSDEEEDDDSTEASGDTLMMPKNVNKEEVLKVEKEKRQQSKVDHEKKKDKDKKDRESQKQKSTDRKDAEKKRTQKGERRR